MKHKNGQVLFLFVFAVLTIFTFLTLIMNLSKISVAKMKLQKAADAAALVMATYQARCFNAIADKNYILKYPSGEKGKTYDKSNKTSYSFPGMDQIDVSTGFEFISQTEFEDYLRIVNPHQEQQDRFIKIYQKLITKLPADYAAKNNPNAHVVDYTIPSFNFKREIVKIRYRDWQKSVGGSYNFRDQLEAWMMHPNSYSYSMVRLDQKYKIWNTTFKLEAIALGEVVKDRGQLWPTPRPEYKAKLAPTQEKGVMH